MIITLCSTDIVWEDKQTNLKKLDTLFERFHFKTDLIVLPEMFTTGFTMNTALAEPMDGKTVLWMKNKAASMGCAIVGSVPIILSNHNTTASYRRKETAATIVNRALFVEPSGKISHYDKRHLFRMGVENNFYTSGSQKYIVNYKDVNFSLNICYDLRFPVWSRNINNEYDVLINVANFPSGRVKVIEPLVRARAIENLAYMLFVNRVGKDKECHYVPSSMASDFKGNIIGEVQQIPGLENSMPGAEIINAIIDLEALKRFRKKFPAWEDADEFSFF